MQSQPQITNAHSLEWSDRGSGRPAPSIRADRNVSCRGGNTPRRALFPPPFPHCGQMAETENLKARFAVMVTTRELSKLAANGDSDAQFRLGYRFAFCKDERRRNLKRAFSMWKAAAEQGHVRARFYLGTCYDFGSGIRRNARRAMFWYHQAAICNHDVAQYNLALGYRNGLGVPRSQRIAVKWLRVSAAAGNADAQNDLGYCLHEGLGVGKDGRQAFRWYLRAAGESVVRAQFNVGLCYRDGDGIKASKLKAREWLQKAARRRHARAREILRGMLQSTESLGRRRHR
jgi:TPR repeat protein